LITNTFDTVKEIGMKLVRSLLIGMGLIIAGASSGWAWNDLGHITVGEIAWQQLSGPERKAVADILRKHPHIDTYFKKPAGVSISDDEWLFLRAGTWCDAIRPPRDSDPARLASNPVHKFHRGPWHYINFPYKAGDKVGEKLPPQLTATEGDKTDILKQLTLTRDVLKGTLKDDPGIAQGLTPEQNKAVRMCWLFHLVGDLHQPLHATAMINQELFPGPNFGDLGGNLVLIRTNANARSLNLHAYWDGLLGPARGWRDGNDVDRLSEDIKNCHTHAELLTHGKFVAKNLPELKDHPQFADWAEESYRLAAEFAYDNGNLKFAARKEVDAGQVQDNQIPVLPPLFQEKSRVVANKRISLAGYRLADQLHALVAESSQPQ
jgi:hypothetical protein